jgi:hypothetical protein
MGDLRVGRLVGGLRERRGADEKQGGKGGGISGEHGILLRPAARKRRAYISS